MMIPAAMNIYVAEAELKKRSSQFIESELKELRTSNAAERAIGGREFESGYLLGLEVARSILAGEPPIYQAGLKPEDLL